MATQPSPEQVKSFLQSFGRTLANAPKQIGLTVEELRQAERLGGCVTEAFLIQWKTFKDGGYQPDSEVLKDAPDQIQRMLEKEYLGTNPEGEGELDFALKQQSTSPPKPRP